jgi:hypothetical protein
MQPLISRVILACVCAAGLAVFPLHAQNISKIKQSARNAAAAIEVKTENGKSTVTYKGKAVWSGKGKAAVTAQARTVEGKEYAAAFDGQKVLWENVKGAAKKVK